MKINREDISWQEELPDCEFLWGDWEEISCCCPMCDL